MKINFKTGNAAFEAEEGIAVSEIQRIFNQIITKLKNGYTDGVIMDLNGNKIGDWNL